MPVWCLMFPQTLTGGDQVWFDSREPGSIDSYEELREKFLRNFSQQRKAMKNPNEILHIRRKDEEKVEQFMERYISESMNIKGVPEVMKICGFINGVRFSQLTEKLGEDFPTTFDQLMDRVRAFVRGKDTGSKLREWEGKNGGTPGRYGGNLAGRGRTLGEGVRFSPYKSPHPVNTSYYPPRFSTLSRAETFRPKPLLKDRLHTGNRDVMVADRAKYPPRASTQLKQPYRPNPQGYCNYHKSPGHSTESCVQLKKLWEAALKAGQLPLLPKEGTSKVKEEDEDKHFVDMIRRRGSEEEREDRRIKRGKGEAFPQNPAWMNVPLSFSGLTNEDAREMPLNISASVAGHRVAPVHVDGGRGVEVMYEHCFARLQKEVRDRLEEDLCPLVGFSREVAKPLGSITLPFSLREGAKTWTIQLWFSIVRAPSKYNIILGRPGMRALRAIASIAHGCIKFPTPERVVTIPSSAEIVANIDLEGKSKKKHVPRNGSSMWSSPIRRSR
ncbi:uncharacterized protein LOC143592209 [Bidens hawaiensis]|uniref:uncharacterized protein LOC143592209 n=1 Tax=Bidens hawaiensis TaxID=980011 RepID=UPI00404B4457